ncbi:hypothetical protein CsatB_026237 [Cannabis sativa]
MYELAANQSTPTEDQPDETNIDPTQYSRDLPVMTQVLGEQSRHVRGFSHLSRLKAVGGKRAHTITSPASQTITMEQYKALQKKVEEAQQESQYSRQQYETQQVYLKRFPDQFEYLSRAVPGFNLPQMDLPPFPTFLGAGSSSSHPPQTQNNDDDITCL